MLPVSYDFAITYLPQVVLDLKMNRLQVHRASDSLGHAIIWMRQSINMEKTLALLETDFTIIRNLADVMIIPLYVGEPTQTILDRIQAQLKVLFQDRSHIYVPTKTSLCNGGL